MMLLVFQMLPIHVLAESSGDDNQESEVVLFAEEINGEVELFGDIEGKDLLDTIQDDTIVELVEEQPTDNGHFSLIRYISEVEINGQSTSEEIIEGYVLNERIVLLDKADEYRTNRLENESKKAESEEDISENTEEEQNEDSESDNLADPEEVIESEKEAEKEIESETDETNKVSNTQALQVQQSGPLIGLALKHPVSVYVDTNRNSKVLKSYSYGHQLKYRPHSDDWYKATVYIDGKPHSGYIHASDVGGAENVTSVSGVALKQTTSVYSDKTKKSKALKSYQQGHILKYKAHDKDWFITKVFIKGKAHTGYIHTKDVETGVTSSSLIEGIGTKNPTRVYTSASTASKTLKSYRYGHILKYRTFTTDWYQARVFISGEPYIGYIHKNDVGSMNTLLTGYGIKKQTTVYSNTSKNSKSLKSYALGSELKYYPYNKNWYRTGVYINGEKQTGFIHVKDVSANAPLLSGYAQKDRTHIYTSTSKSSKSLKSYALGSELKYYPYSKSWYRTGVYINGKKHVGYIHVKDVGVDAPLLSGFARLDRTHVYSETSKRSKSLKSYTSGSQLKYYPYSKNWYKTGVYINGKKQTGYIHKNDVGDATTVSFVNTGKTYTYNQMVLDIKNLSKAYPDLITYKVVGKSEYGRNLYAVSLGNGKPTTFINGSLHAREWITSMLNMNMIEEYAKAYKQNKNIDGYNARNILNNTTIWFMPMVNPDGVTLQQQGLNAFPKKDHDALIRMNAGSKNFKRWKANAKGVDLNRNFSVDWKTVSGNVSKPNYQNHKGSSAASASETKAVIKFVKEIDPQMTINYHSSGEILYWGYNQKGARYTRDLNYARQISRMTGYYVMPPEGYPSGGGFLQYFTETYKRPSLTPELSPYVGNTNVPISTFTRIWNQNKAVGLYAAQESAKLYKK